MTSFGKNVAVAFAERFGNVSPSRSDALAPNLHLLDPSSCREQVCGSGSIPIQALKRGDLVDGEVKVKVDFDEWEDAKQAHVIINLKQRLGRAPPFYQCWPPKAAG